MSVSHLNNRPGSYSTQHLIATLIADKGIRYDNYTFTSILNSSHYDGKGHNTMTYENITDTVWDYLQAEDTKIAKKILVALDYDIASFIDYKDGEIYIEKVYSDAFIPNYLFNYIQLHAKKIVAFRQGVIS